MNASLARFFPDPLGFRSLQARTGTLVSGSFALQFFDRAFYPNTNLDVYVYSQHRREVGNWVLTMGYTFIPSQRQASCFDTASISPLHLYYATLDVPTAFTFERRVSGSLLKVRIIVALKTPMEIVLGSHSSK